MSEFLGTKIDNIEVNDLVWRQKVNMNFMTLSAVQTVIANYTVDSSPPSPSTYDHTIFCNSSSTAFTITLPSESEGRTLRFIRKDNSDNAVTIKAATGDYVNGTLNGSISLHHGTAATRLGLSVVLVCEGVGSSKGWWGRVLDN